MSKINETVEKYLNEDKVLDYWNNVFSDLDKRFVDMKFQKVGDYNKVAKFLQSAMSLPQNAAMSFATDYGDYRGGHSDKGEAVASVAKTMKRFLK